MKEPIETVLSPEEQDLFKKAKKIAFRYLSKKDYCSFDLNQKLARYIESSYIREYTIRSLVSSNIINDNNYALTLSRNLILYKFKGLSYIKSVLFQKELSYVLDDPLVTQELEQLESSSLEKYIAKVHTRLSSDKLIKHLLSKGYGFNKIKLYL